MLVGKSAQYVRASFENEAEIERVVQDYAELLFGSASIYLPKKQITTVGGKATIPDGYVIDLEGEEWYLVEAERGSHGTWEHIAPQVSKQFTAATQTGSLLAILKLALKEVADSSRLQGLLKELGLRELDVPGEIQRILSKSPIIAIPIDEVPRDLLDWARTLKTSVRVWEIQKYLRENTGEVLYLLPEDARPTLETTAGPDGTRSSYRSKGSNYWSLVLKHGLLKPGDALYLDYGPKGAKKERFSGIVRADGVEIDGQTYSPSYAAVHCMKKAGSQRETANGWTMWRKQDGTLIDDLVSQLPEEARSDE